MKHKDQDMSLDRMFRVSGETVDIIPIALSIPCFKKLYEADKSPMKDRYAKYLAYIYHMLYYKSPYADSEDKHGDIAEAFIGNRK